MKFRIDTIRGKITQSYLDYYSDVNEMSNGGILKLTNLSESLLNLSREAGQNYLAFSRSKNRNKIEKT